MASQKFPVERENNTLNRLRDIIDNLTSPGSFEVLEGYISSHTIDTDILCFILGRLRSCFVGLDLHHQDVRASNPEFQAPLDSVSKEPTCLLRILQILFHNCKLPYCKFSACFDDAFIVGVISLLRHREEKTRACAFAVLERIHGSYPKVLSLYQEALGNELIELSRGPRLAENSDSVARFIFLLLRSPAFAEEAIGYYTQFVMPVLFVLNGSSASIVTMVYCRTHTACQALTIRHLSKRYKACDSSAQVWIIHMLGHLMEIHGAARNIEGLEDPFCEIILCGLSSDSYLVIDAVTALLEQKYIKRYVELRIQTILPRLFGCLYRQSKRFWRQEQRCKILRIIDSVLEYGHDVFERCLIEYNSGKELRKRTQ